MNVRNGLFLWLPLAAWLFDLAPQAHSQCKDATTKLYMQTTAIRLNGNAVRLTATTSVQGGYYNWWYAASNIAFYFNGIHQSTSGMMRSNTLGVPYDHLYTPTLQTYGPGRYYLSSVHDAYTPYCGGVWASSLPDWDAPPPWNTANWIDILRPTISRSNPPPYWLGQNVVQSNEYTTMTPITSNPNGAPELPHFFIRNGAAYGRLTCADCTSTSFQATAPPSGTCGSYDVVMGVSYSGFESDPLWIDINRPAQLQYYSAEGHTPFVAPDQGWRTDYLYLLRDRCNNVMGDIAMNEVFTYWSYQQASTWELPLSAGRWEHLESIGGMRFLRDIMYEHGILGGGYLPQPITTGYNGSQERPQDWVTYSIQQFRAGSAFNNGPYYGGPKPGDPNTAQGVLVQTNDQNHYLDHGAHKNAH